MATPIVFLSDYGTHDPFVGLCHAVIAGLAPDARVLDLTHGISRQAVTEGALVLHDAVPYLPPAVLLAVVDPGVGTSRRAVMLRAGAMSLVGPDNGLLWPAARRLAGPDAAWALPGPAGQTVTFDGRDVFAPAAARLAAGAAPDELGQPIAVESLASLELPRARLEDGAIVTSVVRVDGYGNVALGAGAADLARVGARTGQEVLVRLPGRRVHPVVWARTFADVPVGQPLLCVDAFARLQIAVNHGDAAARLGLAAGDDVGLTRARPGRR